MPKVADGRALEHGEEEEDSSSYYIQGHGDIESGDMGPADRNAQKHQDNGYFDKNG